MFIEIFGRVFLIISRVSALVLAASSFLIWTLLIFVVHFSLMILWDLLVDNRSRKCDRKSLIQSFVTAGIKCFYLPNLKTISKIDRILFYLLIIGENFGLMNLYYFGSNYAYWLLLSSIICVIFATLLGILILEAFICTISNELPTFKNENLVDCKKEIDLEKKHPQDLPIIKQTLAVAISDKVNFITTNDGSHFNNKIESKSLSSKSNDSLTSLEDQPLNMNREMMCSIQDLLANTSAFCDHDKSIDKSVVCADLKNSSISCSLKKDEHNYSGSSIHEVGIPIPVIEGSLKSHHRYSLDVPNQCSQTEPIRSINVLKDIPSYVGDLPYSSYEEKAKTSATTCYEVLSHTDSSTEIVRTDSHYESNDDYEAIYDIPPAQEDLTIINENISLPVVRPNPRVPKIYSLNVNESAVTNATSHDYENIPSAHIHRDKTGVRHWKAYLDIEDRVHDYSTFKERSQIENSSFAPSYYANLHFLNEHSSVRPLSIADHGPSNFSISLPDLSNIKTEVCMDEDASEYIFHLNNDHSQEKISNYETVWYSDISPNVKSDSHVPESCSSIVATINRLKDKESLCNLYYSSLSDLSSKYFESQRHKNMSLEHIAMGNCNQTKKSCTLPKSTSTNFSRQIVTPKSLSKKNNRVIASPKTPLLRLMSLSQSCLQERTLKALQVGKRAFYKPKIHVITPKKEVKVNFASKSNHNYRVRIDPYILKRRVDLSPKDKLILSEASSLIKRVHNSSTSENGLKSTKSESSPSCMPCKVTTEENDTNIFNDEAPHHSTPESNKHIPQISILSSISSVASPDNVWLKMFNDQTVSTSNMLQFPNIDSGMLHLSKNHKGFRPNAKSLLEMSVIEEILSFPSQV